MKTWYTIRLFFHLIQSAIRPQNTAAVLALSECLYKMGALREPVRYLMQDPDSRAVFERRKLIPAYDIEQLNRLPLGTVGREYSEHMLRNNLKPDFFKVLDIKDDVTFMMMRMRQTHDLWHTLTGFSTSVPDELGLLTFMLAQTRTPFSAIFIGASLFTAALKRPHEIVPNMERICEGWRMGMRAKPLFAIDWPAHWQTSLSELRAQYGISSVLSDSTQRYGGYPDIRGDNVLGHSLN